MNVHDIVKNDPSPVKIKYHLSLQIEADTFEGLADGITKAASQGIVSRIEAAKNLARNMSQPGPTSYGTSGATNSSAHLPPDVEAKVDAAVADIGKKRGRPQKTAAEHLGQAEAVISDAVKIADIPVVAVTSAPASIETGKTYTQKDIVDAVTKVAEKFGIPKAKECLAKFEANRASALPVEKYSEFLAHVDTLLK